MAQLYDTDVNKAYIIRGNAAVLKCEIPSFVADFVSVVSWHTDEEENFYPGSNYGWFLFFSFDLDAVCNVDMNAMNGIFVYIFYYPPPEHPTAKSNTPHS